MMPRLVLLENGILNPFHCLIAFSLFLIKAEILKEVLKELKMGNIMVKEHSCWKFIIIFNSTKDKELRDSEKVKDWIQFSREYESEDSL